MKASIVLPTYNEVGNIVDLVRAIIGFIPPGWEYEILIADDNSPDGTFRAVQDAFKDDPNVVPILRTTDRGLAKSIRTGVERATGDWIVIMDTDFTHQPSEIPRMLHLGRVCDVVVGSRFCAGGSMEDVPHYLASLIYNWVIRLILRTQIQDNLSGFLTVNAASMKKLPHDQIFIGYGDYCFRLLHYAQLHNMEVLETPVKYRTRQKGASKSVFWKLLFSYTRAVIGLKRDIVRQKRRPPK